MEEVLEQRSFHVHCQPIVALGSGELVGLEALARFPAPPARPDAWFAMAARAGLGVQLQLAAVAAALELLDTVPHGSYLAVNVGPDAIIAPELPRLLDRVDPSRVVLELTEHLQVADYDRLQRLLAPIRERTRLAIDDTGAGFCSLGHIVNLAPDLIKLDRQFTRGIDRDPARRALAEALVTFGRETGAAVICEGIETPAELATVRDLGVAFGQGYLLGRPAPVAEAIAGLAAPTPLTRKQPAHGFAPASKRPDGGKAPTPTP